MTTALTGWKKLRTPIDVPTPDLVASSQARRIAEQILAVEQEKVAGTSELAARMRRLRDQNHFADLIAETMRKKT